MPLPYGIRLNHAETFTGNPISDIWIDLSGISHSGGDAMGMMGLTYGASVYDAINLMVKTKDGQTIGVQLNGK